MMRSCSAVRRASLDARAWPSSMTMCCRRALHYNISGEFRRSNWRNGVLPSKLRLHFPQDLSRQHLPTRTLHSSPSSSSSSSKLSSSTPHADPSTALPEQLRAVMRLLTNPVVVCTAQDTTAAHSQPRAMTMSSFTSLTLAPPSPLISFNVATPSRTLDAIAAAGRFNVHVLSGDARGAAVANHFTRGNADLDGSVFDGLDGVVLSENGGRMPPLLEGEGVLYVLRCKLAVEDAPSGGLVPVRDHVIVVGQIEEVMSGTSMDGEFGLAYADRRYRKEGDVISR